MAVSSPNRCSVSSKEKGSRLVARRLIQPQRSIPDSGREPSFGFARLKNGDAHHVAREETPDAPVAQLPRGARQARIILGRHRIEGSLVGAICAMLEYAPF